jgi:hypothetical protein
LEEYNVVTIACDHRRGPWGDPGHDFQVIPKTLGEYYARKELYGIRFTGGSFPVFVVWMDDAKNVDVMS